MPFASTRISLQWPPEPAEETTDTLVLTSHDLHFVDIRITKPLPAPTSTDNDSHIDWIITGIENPLEGTTKVEFKHEINSHLKLNTGEAFDIGDFHDAPNGDRSETGIMENWNTGKMSPYEEIWRSIDPNVSTPENYVRELKKESEAACVVYKLAEKESEWLGQMVRIGSFAQGAILNRSTNKVSCVRWFLKEGQWQVVFQNGEEVSKIPNGEDKLGAVVELENLRWKVIESSF